MAKQLKRSPSSRWRVLNQGPETAGDGELLALWLGLKDGMHGEVLLRDLGGLGALIGAPVNRLLSLNGFGPVKAARLVAATALFERRAFVDLNQGPILSSSSSVRGFLRAKLAGAPREIFGCLFLDSRHRLIRYEPMFLGTVDRASVHPREVLRRALELNAAAMILVHNHPSGVAEPSASDIALTHDLIDLLAQVEVRVLDHLVIGRGEEVSLAERGLLQRL